MHSQYGGSGIYIFEKCAGALRMYPYAPEEVESEPAKIGTANHEAGELAIKLGVNAYDLIGQTFNGIEFTSAMADNVQIYVSEVQRLKAQYPDAVVLIEVKVTMSSVSNDVFGYVDCAIYVASQRLLIVGDYKNGFGVVDAGTIQLKHYIVSLLDTYNLWSAVDHISGFICQPRADHIDGQMRYVQYTIADAVQFREMFRQIVLTTKDPKAPLVAGEHCRYCKARASCRTRLERTLDLAFPDAPIEVLQPEEVLALFAELPSIRSQFDKIEELAQMYAQGGKKLEGYKLVKRMARHECIDENGLVEAILSHPASNIKDKTVLYNMRLKGKTALKDIPGVPKTVVDKFFKAPENVGTELVQISDSRPAVGSDSVIGIYEPVQLFDSLI